jgi:micrococcal nuclease
VYEYKAKVLKVVDGDTLDLSVDLGFGVFKMDRFRLNRINTPEIHGSDSARGKQASSRVAALAPVGSTVMIRTIKDSQEKYGKYLAEVFIEQKSAPLMNLNDALVAEGLAVAYDGGKR